MPEEKKEKWLTYLAATTVVLAVLATLSTFFGQKNSTRSVISEIKASNQWSYYQAKKVRSYLFEVEKENLEMELKLKRGSITSEMTETMKGRLAALGLKTDKWEKDMNQIAREAKGFESARDQALNHSKNFGLAIVFLQMAILLSSIAALMKLKAVWVSGLAIGMVGTCFFVNGFVLIF